MRPTQWERVMRENPLLKILISLLESLFRNETAPTCSTLIALTLSILYQNSCESVRGMFNHYISERTDKSLTSLYYTFDYSSININEWRINLIELLISKLRILKKYPIFLIVDDTLVEKYGDCFDLLAILFDHTAKNGTSYLKGHCFVSLVLVIPVLGPNGPEYIRIPVCHRMWDPDKEESKLKMAHDMMLEVIEQLRAVLENQLIACCDSWYPKAEVLELHKEQKIPFICAARLDTAMFKLPTVPEPGKRGRKPIYGEKLPKKDRYDDWLFKDVPGFPYQIATREVMTTIFGHTKCTAFVTKSADGTMNLFLVTDGIDLSAFDCALIKSQELKALVQADRVYLPFALYKLRWHIEVVYLELKSFWGFNAYKLRKKIGIERLINLQSIIYALMLALPYVDEQFGCLVDCSPQERRYYLGELLGRVTILGGFAERLERLEINERLVTCASWFIEAQNLSVPKAQ